MFRELTENCWTSQMEENLDDTTVGTKRKDKEERTENVLSKRRQTVPLVNGQRNRKELRMRMENDG